MLAGQQRRRHHDGDLQAVHCGDEGGPHRDFGLAEADVATYEAIHRLARREVALNVVDACRLIVGFLVGKPRDEFVVGARWRAQGRGLTQSAQRRDLDQLVGDLAQAFLQPRLARLPREPAEAVDLAVALVGAIARQQLDVFDRQEQLVAAGIDKLEAVVRRAERGDRLQTGEAADAVVSMDDEIADREARRFGQHIGGAALTLFLPDEPIAENVLLGDHREVRGFEALLDAEHRERCDVRRHRLHVGERLGLARVLEAMIGEQRHQAFARAGGPRRDDDPARLAQNARDVGCRRVEDVQVGIGAFGGERAATPAVHRVDAVPRRRVEWAEPRYRALRERARPSLAVEIHLIRRHGLVRRSAEAMALQTVDARFVVLLNLREALLDRVVRHVIEADAGAGQIVEQRFEFGMEQRQPVFLPDVAAAVADRFVQRIVARRAAEQRNVARAEQRRRRVAERDFAHRHQRELRHRLH